MAVKPVLEQEYVYTSETTGEYNTVTISLDITEMEEIVTLKTDTNMTMTEVEQVLHGFEADVLKKMAMSLEGNYPARLEYKGRVFKIGFGPDHKVKGISPL
ncbi:MAG: hypothetical protein FWE05_10110 [Defluviitaleaceae bacterium]|nr:hypothetical protein [Defluviitaleaceae bacterium]